MIGIICNIKAFLQLLMCFGVLLWLAEHSPVYGGAGHTMRISSSLCLWLMMAVCRAVHLHLLCVKRE